MASDLSIRDDIEQYSSIVIYAYIRLLELRYNRQMPSEIINVLILFCPTLPISYIGYFLKENASCNIRVQFNKLTITGSWSAKLDEPLPVSLKNKSIISLDLGALIAGAKFRGEFEERLKSILAHVTKEQDRYIMFIDEIQCFFF